MSKSCGSCEIKGREKYIGHHSLDQCKAECLKNDQCKGIDYGILPPDHMKCYLALEDVRLVGTTFRLTYEAFEKHSCLGDTLSINDHYSLKVSSPRYSFISKFQPLYLYKRGSR